MICLLWSVLYMEVGVGLCERYSTPTSLALKLQASTAAAQGFDVPVDAFLG